MEVVFVAREASTSGFRTGYGRTLSARDADGNALEPITYLREGQVILRPEDQPIYAEAKGHIDFEIEDQAKTFWPEFPDGRKLSADTYPVAVRLRNVYVPPVPPPAPEPITLREAAYDTDKCIPWQGADITVTEAARLWTYYTSEGDIATANLLTEKIAVAKAEIRGRFPDVSELDTGEGVTG